MLSYKKSIDYDAYQKGDANGQRFASIPPFEKNELGQLKVAAGEVYCRFVHDNGELCDHNGRFSNESNLRTHIKRHRGAEIEPRSQGAKSTDENHDLRNFYARLMLLIRADFVGEEPAATTPVLPDPVPTPSKPKVELKVAGIVKSKIEPPKMPNASNEVPKKSGKQANQPPLKRYKSKSRREKTSVAYLYSQLLLKKRRKHNAKKNTKVESLTRFEIQFGAIANRFAYI